MTDYHQPKCSNRYCSNIDCSFQHDYPLCNEFRNCKVFNCPNRHHKNRTGPCKKGIDCTKENCSCLHPITKCKLDQLCTIVECPSVHSTPLCANHKKCDDFKCSNRHHKNRTGKCRFGASCSKLQSVKDRCPFLHPPDRPCPYHALCKNTLCKLIHPSDRPLICDKGCHCEFSLCLRLHPQSQLEKFLNSKAPTGLVNTMKMLSSARKKHQENMVAVGQRYFHTSQNASGSEEDCAQRRKYLLALEREAQELRLQCAAFDAVVMREVEFYKIGANGSSQDSVSCSKFKHNMRREAYRLELALPALALRLDIEKAICKNQFVIVQGATGSGKSTQMPAFVYELLRAHKSNERKVICTQPRKVSAISLAERVSEEWHFGRFEGSSCVGGVVGYRVGSNRKVSKHTGIEYVTEGTFLSLLLKLFAGGGEVPVEEDPLQGIGAIVVDEAHERSINCDIILGILRTHAPTRWPQLKVVVTSATLDTELFSKYFYDAPVLQIPGRMFPVEVKYLPEYVVAEGKRASGKKVPCNGGYQDAVVSVAFDIHRNTPIDSGDILCFLTGQDEVEKARDLFATKCVDSKGVNKTLALALFGKQPPEEQKLVFKRTGIGIRKVIFATDVAETGVTIDGVRHIVDTGLCKESSFDNKRNVTVLEVKSICQSSATQRKGRAGRTAPGTCYRLYSEDDFNLMQTTKTAEVLSRPLQLTTVSLVSMSIDPISFAWPQSPDPNALMMAMKELVYLGALNVDPTARSGYSITEVGKLMALLQIDPGIARMIYHSCQQGMGEAGCCIAALMSVSSSFFRRPTVAQKEKNLVDRIDEKHAAFNSSLGDMVSMFDAYSQWESMLEAHLPQKQGITGTESNSVAWDDVNQSREREGDLCGDIDVMNDNICTLVDMGFAEEACKQALVATSGSVELALEYMCGGIAQPVEVVDSNERYNEVNDEDDDLVDDCSISLSSADDSQYTNMNTSVIDAVAEEEAAAEKLVSKFAASKVARRWCENNFLNGKSLGMVKCMKRDLLRNLNAFGGGTLWNHRNQCITPSPEAIQRLLVKSLFLNCAIQMRNPIEYEVLRNNIPTVGQISPGSCLQKKFNSIHGRAAAYTEVYKEAQRQFFPDFIVFGDMLTTSKTYLNLITPAAREWIFEESEAFFNDIVSPQLQKIRSELVVFCDFHNFTARKVLGKRGEKRRSIEDKWACSIQYDAALNRLDVWCVPEHVVSVKGFFEKELEKVRNQALEEVEEATHMGNTRVLFGPGAVVEKVLFRGEYVTVNIRNLAQEITENELQLLAVQYGGVRGVDFVPGDHSSSAAVTFWNPEDAKRVVEELNGETIGGKIVSVTSGGITAQSATSQRGENNQLVMSWATAASDGTAQISFNSAKAANSIIKLCNRGRNCPILQSLGPNGDNKERVGVYIRAMVPRNGSTSAESMYFFDESNESNRFCSLKISGLHLHVDEIELSKAIDLLRLKVLRDLPHPEHVKINRPFATNETLDESSLDYQTAELACNIPLMNCADKLLSCTSFFDTDSKGTSRGRAGFYLQYSGADVIEEALSAWHKLNTGIDAPSARFGQPIRIVAKLSSALKMHDELFEFYSQNFAEVMKTVRIQYGVVCKVIKPKDNRIVRPESGKTIQPFTSISVSADNHAALRTVMGLLSGVLQSRSYEPPDESGKMVLFSTPGRAAMQQLSRQNSYFHWDCSARLVRVYGHSAEAIAHSINRIADEVARLTSLLGYKMQFVVARRKRKNLMQAWYKLPRGRGSIKNNILEFSVARQTVAVHGSEDAICKVQDWMNENNFLSTPNPLADVALPSDGALCNLCFCELENPYFYRVCGHGACTECVCNQTNQIDMRGDVTLPLVCRANKGGDCLTKLALTDIIALSSANAYAKIKETSLMKYIRENCDKVRLCPSVGCGQVLNLTNVHTPIDAQDEIDFGGKTAFCDQCAATYCLFCSDRDCKPIEAHMGCACADSLPNGRNEVLKHYRHITENILTLRCPHCDAAFFDWDGCCAVHCDACSKYFCGLCQDAQSNSSLSHDHIYNRCSLNPKRDWFASPDVIATAHRNVRVKKLRAYIATLSKGTLKRQILAEISPLLPEMKITVDQLV